MLTKAAAEPALELHTSVSPSRQSYTIRDLAREFGLTLRTLRFYEDRGLISPERNGSARLFTARDRARLAVIVKAKALGFTLSEIKETLADDGRSQTQGLPISAKQVEDQIAYLQQQKADVEAALDQLYGLRDQMMAPQSKP
jgi:DNA-binding transcriptional MerR regulator